LWHVNELDLLLIKKVLRIKNKERKKKVIYVYQLIMFDIKAFPWFINKKTTTRDRIKKEEGSMSKERILFHNT
jgi:hypothetical protein